MATGPDHRGWLNKPSEGILAFVYNRSQAGATALATNTALDGVLVAAATPAVLTPALAVDSIVFSNNVADGDFLITTTSTAGNSQSYLWIDSSAGTMTLYGAGTAVATTAATYLRIEDDILLAMGTSRDARFSWDTTDANAEALFLHLPGGSAPLGNSVPVVVIGQSIESVDLGLFDGLVDPNIAIFGMGAVATGPRLRAYKARGTVTAPTVVTTGDDLFSIDAYGCVAAGEYVQAARILFEMTGTIATTRGPGVITFQTATDAAPSVLTTALTIDAGVVVNEGGADRDFRVESDGIQYAVYVDGAKNALVLGSNTDTSSVDQLITVSRAARTATAATNYFDLVLAPAGAVTQSGTTTVIGTVSLAEPNITAGGTVTNATTLYIASQPTEGGTTNSALFFGAAANIAGTTSITFNEDSQDVDFRFESNGMAYAIYSDGGKDALVLGSNTDTSSADQLITISRAARTATATVNYYDFVIAPAGAVTVPVGVTAVVATAAFNEPNITNSGTLTAATTVYIIAAPTEGSSNYALWVDSGAARFDGDIDLAAGAIDILVIAATAAALEVSDGTTKFYAFDTRVATAGVTSHALDVADYTFASAATNVATSLSLAAHTLNYTGTTQVTSEAITVSLGARTIAGDTATLTVDKASTLKLIAPIEGTNITLTVTSALRIATATGSPTNQYGIYIESLSGGTTANRGIYLAGANGIEFAAADDIIFLANTAAALELSDGTTKLLAFDTRNTVTVDNVIFTAPASQTLPNAATAQWRHVSLAAHTVTLVGQTQVTTVNQGAQLLIGAPTYAQSGGAVTVDQVSTVHIAAPVAGGSVTITANRMISTSVADCYLTGAGVWTDTVCTEKVKDDIAPLDFGAMAELIEKIEPVRFKYNAERLGAYDLDRQRYGVVAERLPEFLRVPGEVNPSGMSGTILGAFSLAGVRYLHEANKALVEKVAGLERRLAAVGA